MVAIVLAGDIVLSVAACFGQAGPLPSTNPQARLRRFLQQYVDSRHFDTEKATHYSATFVDLKDDGKKEAIVYLTEDGWCGTCGCRSLILAPSGSTYRFIANIMCTRLPIRVLSSKSHGWHDIAVESQWGAGVPGYEAQLAFNGVSYPISTSNHRARRVAGKAKGQIVVPLTAEGAPLF